MTRFGLFTVLILATAPLAPVATAEEAHEHRQHGTHEHGVGRLHLAQQGAEVHLELTSPAENLIGFEHAPASAAERETVTRTLAALKDGKRLFRFSGGAKCSLLEANVATRFEEHWSTAAHEPEEEAAQEAEAHGKVHDQGQGESHTDINAEYRFTCVKPAALQQLEVTLFQAYPATRRLQVEFVTAAGQGATELTAANPVLRF